MTRVPGRLLGFVLALAAIAAPAAAQDDPRYALVTSFPTPTVSFQWEISERFALRIEGSYSFRDESSDTTTGQGSWFDRTTGSTVILSESVNHVESSSHTGSIGVAGIFTIHRIDQLRLYVAPRVSIVMSSQRTTATTTVTLPPGLPPNIFRDLPPVSGTFESSSTSPAAGASFGAAANVHRHLALFGEAGFTYFRTNIPPVGTTTTLSSVNDFNVKSSNINTRAVGGVMLLF